MRTGVYVVCLSMVWLSGCSQPVTHTDPHGTPPMVTVPDTRETIALGADARNQHRAVMQQHLESVEQVVAALAREDFVRAKGLTETHLGFFKHRQAMMDQEPGDFPPAYHDLAMAHHEAAEELAQVIPSRDWQSIMSKLDGVLRACVACHHAFTTREPVG